LEFLTIQGHRQSKSEETSKIKISAAKGHGAIEERRISAREAMSHSQNPENNEIAVNDSDCACEQSLSETQNAASKFKT
jgi:hypothetical protein